MMWYEILMLFIFLGSLVSLIIFLMWYSSKELIKIQELRNWQIKFYKTIVEVYSNEQEKK